MADLWSAVSALVGNLLKGKPQLCLVSKARRVDMVKHNKTSCILPLCQEDGQDRTKCQN